MCLLFIIIDSFQEFHTLSSERVWNNPSILSVENSNPILQIVDKRSESMQTKNVKYIFIKYIKIFLFIFSRRAPKSLLSNL